MPGFQVGGGVNYRDETDGDTTNVNSVSRPATSGADP
jgi:hypothetical protein